MPETIEHDEAAIVPVGPATALVEWTPRFSVAVDEAIARKAEKQRFFRSVMDEDLHYGKIPGTGTKPTLLKPGAEMLLSNMGLNQEFDDAEPPMLDFDGTGIGNGEPIIRYRRICRIYRQTGLLEHERMLVARAEGSCSSREEKYRYRNSSRECPECNGAFIIRGKEEYGGGWLCFKKKGGCGAKFEAADRRITGQAEGKVPHPNVADLENTILKMADKRALVAATLLATGCSDIFTQDVEDGAPEAPEPPQTPPPPRAAKPLAPKPPVLPDSGAPGDHDPVRKGAALDALSALRRERFISPALYQALLCEMMPHHVSAISKIVSEGDLSVEELRLTWAELNRRTKPPKPAAPASDDAPLFDGLEDEVAL